MSGKVITLQPNSNYARGLLEEVYVKRRAYQTTEDENDNALSLQWCNVRDVNWTRVLNGSVRASVYNLKTALTRKADMHKYLHQHMRKLKTTFSWLPETYVAELDDEDQTMEEFIEEMSILLEKKQCLWILKDSEANRGEDIYVFKAMAEVSKVLLDCPNKQWIVQKYIDRPLLLKDKKFHIRVHVLAVGDMQVYLHDNVVVMPAVQSYTTDAKEGSNKYVHVTNHCVQKSHADYQSSNKLLVELDNEFSGKGGEKFSTTIMNQLKDIIPHIFAGTVRIGYAFFPLSSCFELFGLDFMIDEDMNVFLLEVNSDPSYSVFEERLRPACLEVLEDTAVVAVDRYPASASNQDPASPCTEGTRYSLVYSKKARYPGATDLAVFRRLLDNMGSLAVSVAESKEKETASTKPICAVSKLCPKSDIVTKCLEMHGACVVDNPKVGKLLLQWGLHRELLWERVLNGVLAVNHFHLRRGLLRRVELFMAVESSKRKGQQNPVPVCINVSKSTKTDELVDRLSVIPNLGNWWQIIGESDSGNLDLVVLKREKSTLPSLSDRLEHIPGTCVVQQFITSPRTLKNGRIFNILASVVVRGTNSGMRVDIHKPSVAVLASSSPLVQPDVGSQDDVTASHCCEEEMNLDDLSITIGLERDVIMSKIFGAVSVVFAALEKKKNLFLAIPGCFEAFTLRFVMEEERLWLLGASQAFDGENLGEQFIVDTIKLCVAPRISGDEGAGITHNGDSWLSVDLQ